MSLLTQRKRLSRCIKGMLGWKTRAVHHLSFQRRRGATYLRPASAGSAGSNSVWVESETKCAEGQDMPGWSWQVFGGRSDDCSMAPWHGSPGPVRRQESQATNGGGTGDGFVAVSREALSNAIPEVECTEWSRSEEYVQTTWYRNSRRSRAVLGLCWDSD